MNLHILHTISGLLIIVFFVAKVILHYYLDYRLDSSTSFIYSLAAPAIYFKPYRRNLPNKLRNLQQLCNVFIILSLVALIANLLIGLAIFFEK